MGLEVGELLAPHSLESHCPFLALRRLLQLPLFKLLEVPNLYAPNLYGGRVPNFSSP